MEQDKSRPGLVGLCQDGYEELGSVPRGRTVAKNNQRVSQLTQLENLKTMCDHCFRN